MIQATKTHKLKNGYLLLAKGLLLAVWAANATSKPTSDVEPDYFSMSFEELLQVKVTSATLTDESLKTVPASVTVFTRAQIRQLGVNSLFDLMNYVPGYQSSISDESFRTYSSRSRRLAANTKEVLIIMNGQRLNHDYTGTVSPFTSYISLNNVERIEFIRGPGSAIYGANAFLGVINITTASEFNEVSISTGSHQNSAAINISHHFANGLHTSLSLNGIKDKGELQPYYDSITLASVEDRALSTASGGVLAAKWGEWSLNLGFNRLNRTDGYLLGQVGKVGGEGEDSNQTSTSSGFSSLSYIHTFNDHWRLNSRVFYTPYSLSFGARGKDTPLIIARGEIEGRESGIENHLSWQQGSAKLLIGFDYTKNTVNRAQSTLWLPPAAPPPYSDVIVTGSRTVNAVYAQWQDELTDDLTYILGVRNDHYSDVDGHTSPRAGLIWQVDDANTVKLIYGEAFRAPARNEVDAKATPAQVGNPNLNPEISKTTELVWSQTSRSYFTSVTLFNTVITDPVSRTNTLPSTFVNNASDERLTGVEAEARWSFNDHWVLNNTLSHLFNTPLDINADAIDLASASLIYSRNALTFSFSGRFHGKTRDQDSSTRGYHALGGFTLFDAHAEYQLNQQWYLFATLRNVSNKQYRQAAIQNSANIVGVEGLGREMELGVRWSFD